MHPLLYKPSFHSHILTGIALIAVIIILLAHREKLRLSLFQTVLLILVIGILAGVHGLSHQGLERDYGYNPLEMLQSVNLGSPSRLIARGVVSPSPSPSSAGDALFMRTRL